MTRTSEPSRVLFLWLGLVALLVLVVLGIAFVPWDWLPGGELRPVAADDVFSAAQIERAETYSSMQRRLSWIALGVSVLVAIGLGLIGAALMVSYRDVQHILPVALQLLLYASPVAYAAAVVPYPLFVTGGPGEATLCYIRLLPDNRLRVGIEFWGHGAFESEPIVVPDRREVEIIYAFPALYPNREKILGRDIFHDKRSESRTNYRVSVNGREVVAGRIPPGATRDENVVYGVNPAGGSLVGNEYTGRILQVTRPDGRWMGVSTTGVAPPPDPLATSGESSPGAVH